MTEAVIVAAVRSPIGRAGRSLAPLSLHELGRTDRCRRHRGRRTESR